MPRKSTRTSNAGSQSEATDTEDTAVTTNKRTRSNSSGNDSTEQSEAKGNDSTGTYTDIQYINYIDAQIYTCIHTIYIIMHIYIYILIHTYIYNIFTYIHVHTIYIYIYIYIYHIYKIHT